jgi:DNA-binding response OmpR family regulator
MSRAPDIAVVDDDAQMRAALDGLLRENGFHPHLFSGGEQLAATGQSSFDLYLIDLRLVEESGLDIARDVHRTQGTPIIMFTGIGDEIDKIIGLEAGADDYILKPFNPRELIARIRALLRRSQITEPSLFANQQNEISNCFQFGDFTVDYSNRILSRASGELVSLTNAEFRLLEYLTRNANRIIERVDLLNHLGSDLSQYVDRTIDVLILRLRRKIEPAPSKPVHLQTRRGKGYIFVTDQGEATDK